VSQGSAATELRRGGRFISDSVRHFFLDATLKEFLHWSTINTTHHTMQETQLSVVIQIR